MFDTFPEMLGDGSTVMLGLLVFLATAVLSFGMMVGLRSRGADAVVSTAGGAHTSALTEPARRPGPMTRPSRRRWAGRTAPEGRCGGGRCDGSRSPSPRLPG